MSRENSKHGILGTYANKDLQTARILCLVVTVLIPLLGVIYEGLNPEARNYASDRVVLPLIGLFFVYLSYKFRLIRDRLHQIVHVFYYLVTLWTILVASVNHFSVEYALGLVAVISASSIGFRSINQLSSYFLLTITTSSLACWLVPDPAIDRNIFVGSIAIIGLISFIALRTRLVIQQNLAISEDLMKTIFDESADALFLVKQEDQKTIDCNLRAVEMFEAEDKEQLVGTNLYNLPDLAFEIDPFEKILGDIRQNGKWEKELQFKTFKGSGFWGDMAVKDIHISKQTLHLIRISDISDRKRAQEELAWLASFPENDPVPILEMSFKGEITYANPIASHLFPKINTVGTSHPILAGITSFIEQFQQEKKTGSFREVRFRDSYFIQNISLVPNRRLIRIYNVDISERKRAEQAIAVSEAKNRALLNAVPDTMYRINQEGIFLDYKPSKDKQLAAHPEEIVTKSIHEVLPKDVAVQIKTFIDQTLESDKTQVLEYQLLVGDQMRDFEARFVVSGDAEILALVRDITKRKDLDRRLIAAREAALEASRMKSEFVANVSHEIRTPLHGIIGFTDLLTESELNPQQGEHCGVIRSSSETLLALINEILDFSKIETGELELEKIDFDLRDCLEDSMKGLLFQAQKQELRLSQNISSDVPSALTGDPGRLRQILINLIENSIKFTERGEIKLHVGVESQADDDVVLHFSVRDTGIGIPSDKLDMIFYAFAQGDGSATRKYGGTGLGLAISRQLIEMMDGSIWVESEVDKGSIFHFTGKFELQSRLRPRVSLPVPEFLDNKSALVADANPASQRILAELLSKWKMNAILVHGGQEALLEMEKAKSNGKQFDLILVDSNMPDIDGFTIVDRINQMPEFESATIVMLPTAGRRGDAARCRSLGVSAYLAKPIRQKELQEAILTCLSRKTAEEAATSLVTRHSLREEKRRVRILVAEDNLVVQELSKKILESRGHTVHVVPNGKKVLSELEKSKFDLILMDLQMPLMDGLGATAAIRNREKETDGHIPIVAMTGYAKKGDRERCLRSGMDAYVSKPIRKHELFAVIDALVSNSKMHGTENENSEKAVKRDDSIRLQGDPVLVKKFLQNSQKWLTEIQIAIQTEDGHALGKAARSLKIGLANFESMEAFNAALRLEIMGRQKEYEKAKLVFNELKQEITRLEVDFASTKAEDLNEKA